MPRSILLVALAALLWPAAGPAQMPDARAMSGMSMPTADLPDGTVSVRVVRGQMSNNLTGVEVELHGAGPERHATTGTDGRAQFTGVPAGAQVHALAVVGGERLETQPFEVPARGGVRALLVASEAGAPPAAPARETAPPAAGAATPAAPSTGASQGGPLSIGGNSRIALEFSDDTLQVFYLFEIVNRTGAPVSPESALVFDMPTGAAATTVLEGSTPQANAKGPRVTVAGPFAAGVTPLQMAVRVETFGPSLTLEQRFPLPIDMVAVAVEKVDGMRVVSPQIARTQEAPIETSTFIMGTGPRLDAGTPLRLQLEGLPYHSRFPVYLALGLVGAIVAGAVGYILTPGQAGAETTRRRQLERRREQGLAALAALEQQHRSGTLDDEGFARRRAALMAQLERVYGELDAEGGTPGGQGVAA